MVYKITKKLVELPQNNILDYPTETRTRRVHQYKLNVKKFRCNIGKFNFPNRIVKTWNSLNSSTVNAKNLSEFKMKVLREMSRDITTT